MQARTCFRVKYIMFLTTVCIVQSPPEKEKFQQQNEPTIVIGYNALID